MASRKQYWAIKTALTRVERELISFYEIKWMFGNKVPTVDEVVEHLRTHGFENVRQTSVNYYLNRPPVIKALEQRGINFRQHTQNELTDKQQAVIYCLANFADTRSNEEKLDSLGVNSATYYAWLQDPVFQNHMQMLADRNLKNIDPVAKTEFSKKVQEGHWGAIKHYLDTTGALVQPQGQDTETLVRGIIEVIQMHVKDAATIIAIANDIKNVMQNRTLSYDMEGDTVQVSERGLPPAEQVNYSQVTEEEAYRHLNNLNDDELARAKKMVGF